MTPYQKYRDAFQLNSEDSSGPQGGVSQRALEQALDIRKFEIGLYWQRATYFWTLIAATFAGYFAVLGAENIEEKHFFAFVLSCFGLIFSLAWFLTNRGSKYWQENWENHVDLLEDKHTGPLYKTVLERPSADSHCKRLWFQAIEGPAPFSVSQINQWVSLFTVCIWIPLAEVVVPNASWDYEGFNRYWIVAFMTGSAILLLALRTRSSVGKTHRQIVKIRRTKVVRERKHKRV